MPLDLPFDPAGYPEFGFRVSAVDGQNFDAMFPLSSPASVDSATKGPESR